MEGKKFDDGKIDYSLIPPKAIESIGAVFTYGANKYSPWNWTKLDSKRLYSAILRHLMENEKENLSLDSETNFFHLDHAIVSLIMYREKLLIEKEKESIDYVSLCKNFNK